jgi:hypothetical protein
MAGYLQGLALNMASIANALEKFMHPFGPCLDVADDDVHCLVSGDPVRDVSAAHEEAHILQGVSTRKVQAATATMTPMTWHSTPLF